MIEAKLSKPSVTDDIIVRPRLINWFENRKKASLVLVIAPAGFGKSTCISQWLDYNRRPYSWISLDEDDNQIQSFLWCLIKSAKSAYPKLDLNTEQLLLNIDNPGFKVITNTLLNDLDKIDEKLTFVLDDYHLIKNASIHKLLNKVLRYVRSNIKFIILSRTLPLIKLSKIKIHSKIAELNIDELQFQSNEFDNLLERKNIHDLAKINKDNILSYTEGWVAGIQVVLNDLERYGELAKGLPGIKHAKEQIFDIFLEDVFSQQDPIIKKQLVLSAHLKSFSEDLINHISTECFDEGEHIDDNRSDFIRYLQRRNLFLVKMGASNEFYRYHHLFQEFLIKHSAYVLEKEMLNCLFISAATWYSDKGFVADALAFALKADNDTKALEIFAKHRLDLVNTEQFSRLLQCLQLFPANLIEKTPILILSRALLADSKANYIDMASDLSVALELLKNEQENKALNGEIYALTACMKYLTGETNEALNFSSLALDNLQASPGYIHDFATAYRVMATFSEHSVKESITLIDNALVDLTTYNVYGKARLLSIKSMIHSIDANYDGLERVSLSYIALSKENNLMMSWVMASYFLGMLYYKKNQLKEAKEYLEKVMEAKFFGRPYWNLFCSKVYIDTLSALGEIDACVHHLAEIDSWVADRKDPGLEEFVKVIKTEFAIAIGDTEEAIKMVSNYNIDNFPIVPFYAYFPQLTLQKVRLLDNDPKHWDSAFNELEQLSKVAREKRFNSLLVETALLKAVYYEKVGELVKARENIVESIAAVKGGENIRTYTDLKLQLSATIFSFTESECTSELLKDIIRFYKKNESYGTITKSQNSKKGAGISQREKEIVHLISKGLQNSEIANELYVSEDTVKKHLYNAYRKLGVRNRISAIQEAKKKNII